MRLPWFDVSLPRGEALVGWDSGPSRASALTPAAVTERVPGPGSAPVVLFLVSLSCLAVAAGRRIHALRRRAGNPAPGEGAEADHGPSPAATEVDDPSLAETEVEEVPSRLDASPQLTMPHPWDQPPSPVAEQELDEARRSPDPWFDQSGPPWAAGSEADGGLATAASSQEPEPPDTTLTVRPASTVIHTRSAPDDFGERPHHEPGTGPTLGEVTIIRAPKHGRLRR